MAIVCLRCGPQEAKDPARQAAVKEALLDFRFVNTVSVRPLRLLRMRGLTRVTEALIRWYAMGRQVRSALTGRTRRPNVAQEFPIVALAELEEVEEAKQTLLETLRQVTGITKPQAPVRHMGLQLIGHTPDSQPLCPHADCAPLLSVGQAVTPLAVSATVEVGEESVLVKPITRDNQTDESPFSVVNAGPRESLHSPFSIPYIYVYT